MIERATALRPAVDTTSLLAFIASVATYLAGVRVGVLLMLPEDPVSLLWPATGAALAAVWLFGRAAVAGIVVAGTIGHLFLGYPPTVAFGVGVAVAVAAQLGVSLLRRYDFATPLGRLRDVVVLLSIGVIVTATLGSLAMATAGYLTGIGKSNHFGELWWLCWVAQIVGNLVVVPALLGWSASIRGEAKQRRGLEAIAVLLTAAGIGWLVYSDTLPSGIAMARPLSYLIFPVMIWAAVRTTVRDTALILLVHAAIAVALTVNGHGPFISGSMQESLLALHAHIAMLSVSSLILAAIMTERQAVTAALADSEAKYRLLVENQTDLVIKTDDDDRIVFASPTVAELFGGSVASLIGSPFRAVVGDVDPDDESSPWRALFGEQGACYLERRARTRYGERWLGWAVKALRDDQGEFTGVVAVGRDVTARRQAEADAREYFQELAHVGRLSAMGEMAAGLAHELNQPLCAMTTYAQACRRLLDADDNPQLSQAIDRVIANGERAGGIIQQMRAYVRKDAPEQAILDLNTAISEVLALNEPELRQAEISVHRELADELSQVAGVEIQIHQVLVNLVRNAMEALRDVPSEQRSLLVSTAERNGTVTLIVEDTGPGLTDDILQSLFDPFVSGKSDGLGLGLSISRSIVESHGGTLTGENRTGGGARFTLHLPVTTPSTEAA